MELLKFFIILQKILFFLVLIFFIPITVVVFSPKLLSISNSAEAAYVNLYNQANRGFIVQKPNGINCSNQFLIRANSYCFQYCTLNQDCSIIQNDQACTIGTEQFTLNQQYKYCAANNILNSISFTSSSNYSIMSHSNSVPPLYQINSQNTSDLVYYIYNGQPKQCRQRFKKIGSSIQKFDEMLFTEYSSSLQNQFYPFLVIYTVVLIGFIVDMCSKYNFRHFIVVGMMALCVLEFSLALIGIIFKITSNNFVDDLVSIANICVVQGVFSISTQNYLKIDSSNGISMGFVFFLAFICFVLLASLLGLIVIAYFQYKAGKAKHEASSGYQLQAY